MGLVSAAQWLPYLLFGLLAGVLLDRRRRLPLQLGCDVGSGLVLLAIPVLAYTGVLNLGWLLLAMFGFGLLSLVNSVASQSFVPRLVPVALLPAANARFDQGQAAADTAGPALGGGLVSLLGAANAVLVDAASYFLSALALARVPCRNRRRSHSRCRSVPRCPTACVGSTATACCGCSRSVHTPGSPARPWAGW